MNFICKECNDFVEVDSLEEILIKKKLCDFCRRSIQHDKGIKTFNLNHKVFIAQCKYCDSDIETFIAKNGTANKKYCNSFCYHRYHKAKKQLTCEWCNKPFIGLSARFCSSECRSKGIEDFKFKKDLQKANILIAEQKVKIYGFGSSRYEDNKFKKEIEKK